MSPLLRSLDRALAGRILMLDGAMGTMVQQYKLDEATVRGTRFRDHSHLLKNNIDLLVLTRPDLIASIHHAYLDAGADIIETNTFGSTSIAQSDFGLEAIVYELNVEAARLAREAADEWTTKTPACPRYVAGAIGPTNRTLSISPDVNNPAFRATTFALVRQAYREQVRGLLDGGVDLLLLETVFDTLNAKAAIAGIHDEFEARGADVPLMISATIADRSGRTLSGQMLDAFYVSIQHARPFSVGLNCAFGAQQMRPYMAELSRLAGEYVTCHPNAGLPNAFGEYDELPEQTAALLRDFADVGLSWTSLEAAAGRRRRTSGRSAKPIDGVTPRRARQPEPGGRERRHRSPHALLRAGNTDRASRLDADRRRRADQRHRIEAFRQHDLEPAVPRCRSDCPRAGARRREHPRHQHGRRDARLGGGDDDVPERRCGGARDRAAAVHDRQLEVVGARSGPAVRPGQGDRQLDQPEGGRRGLPSQGTNRPAIRRGARRDGVRRTRPGRHRRSQD